MSGDLGLGGATVRMKIGKDGEVSKSDLSDAGGVMAAALVLSNLVERVMLAVSRGSDMLITTDTNADATELTYHIKLGYGLTAPDDLMKEEAGQ